MLMNKIYNLLLTLVFLLLSYWFFQDRSLFFFLALSLFSINWIWILQEAVEDTKEETVVEEAVGEEVVAVEAAEMVIGFARTLGK